jgi:hypothetical protein
MPTNILVESPRVSSRAKIALNSTVATSGDFVSLSGGFVTTASAGTPIVGISNQTKTYTASNQTVARETLSYTVATETTVVRCAITGGTITAADEGKFYNLSTANVVNGATESAVESYVDTVATSATDPVVKFQLKLVRFITATLGEFTIVI